MSTLNKRSVIYQLNKYLQGIHMGIDTFILLKEKAKTVEHREQCEQVLLIYEQHKLEIATQIEQLNGQVKEEGNIFGKLSNYFAHRKLERLQSDQEIAVAMKDSFSTGITMVEKFLAQHSQAIPSAAHELILDFLDKNLTFQKNFHW